MHYRRVEELWKVRSERLRQVCTKIEVAVGKEGKMKVLEIELGSMVEDLKELWKERSESMKESIRDMGELIEDVIRKEDECRKKRKERLG